MTVADKIDYYYPQLDKARVRSFMKALATVSRKRQYQEVLKKKLANQLEQVKKVSSDKRSSKERIEKEIAKLHDTVSQIMNTEHRVMARQEEEVGAMKQLSEQLSLLHEKFEIIQNNYEHKLKQNERQIDEFRKTIQEMKTSVTATQNTDRTRIQEELKKELEKKIDERARLTKAEVDAIDNHIMILEANFEELRKRKDTKIEDIERIKQRLGSAKKSLIALKQNKSKK
ncbi:hypothetical protein JW968_01490 [Candidatus Woesearchaeota archaeon]|nr:hypothetical protein [Candidatus Woesearchaeota archaeon]